MLSDANRLGRRPTKSRSPSKRLRYRPRKFRSRPKPVRNYKRAGCNSLQKNSCSSDPNCHWTRNKKSPCRAKSKVRQGVVHQGPLPKQFK